MAYVDPSTDYVGNVYYGRLTEQRVLADEVLQTNEGPSFPAHQYLIAGQSGGINNIGSTRGKSRPSGNPQEATPVWAPIG